VSAHDWTPGHFRLFISHHNAESVQAGALRGGLRRFHIDAFVAHATIAPTVAWQDEIEDALLTCEGCVAILSTGFKGSDWCDQEVGVCFGRGVLVLAIDAGVSPYGFIGRYQAFNPRRYESNEALCEGIFEQFRDHERSREALAAALVHRFEHSDSYAAARANLDRVKSAPSEALTYPLLDRIERAHQNNRQVAEANYYFAHSVPEEARGFVDGLRPF